MEKNAIGQETPLMLQPNMSLCVSDSRVCSTVGPPTSCSGVMRVFLCEGQSMLEGTDADPSSSLTLCCCGE